MNRLPPGKRTEIALLLLAGHSVREVAKETDTSRETVQNLTLDGYRRRIFKLLDRVDSDFAAHGIDASSIESYNELLGTLGWTCPIHSEAQPDEADPSGCKLCIADGLRRHHERRKAEGRPIAPPRRRSSSTPATEAAPAIGYDSPKIRPPKPIRIIPQ